MTKVKKQGWINIYQDNWGGYYGLSVWSSEETAKSYLEKDASVIRDKCVATVKIEWEDYL